MISDQCRGCVLALLVLVWAILVFFGLGGTCQLDAAQAAADINVIENLKVN